MDLVQGRSEERGSVPAGDGGSEGVWDEFLGERIQSLDDQPQIEEDMGTPATVGAWGFMTSDGQFLRELHLDHENRAYLGFC